jgi:hypothetical protein
LILIVIVPYGSCLAQPHLFLLFVGLVMMLFDSSTGGRWWLNAEANSVLPMNDVTEQGSGASQLH